MAMFLYAIDSEKKKQQQLKEQQQKEEQSSSQDKNSSKDGESESDCDVSSNDQESLDINNPIRKDGSPQLLASIPRPSFGAKKNKDIQLNYSKDNIGEQTKGELESKENSIQ